MKQKTVGLYIRLTEQEKKRLKIDCIKKGVTYNEWIKIHLG